jgi:hypothetical protein
MARDRVAAFVRMWKAEVAYLGRKNLESIFRVGRETATPIDLLVAAGFGEILKHVFEIIHGWRVP